MRNSFPLLVSESGLLLSSRKHLRPEHHQASETSSGESLNHEQNEASSSESSTNGLLVLPLEGESGPMSVELAPLFPVEVAMEEDEVLLMLLIVVVESRLVDATYLLVLELRSN